MTSPTAAIRPLLRAVVVLFSLVALVGTFVFVTRHSAGQEPRALQAKVLGGLVADALNEYRRLHQGEVPASVEELRGLHKLSTSALTDFTSGTNPTFAYVQKDKSSFSLSFEYTGPGFTHCDYVDGSNPVEWKCTRHD